MNPLPDDSPLLGCRGRICETYIILTQMDCKPICDARVETTVSSLYIATYPQVTHFLTLWRILLASINLNDYILVTDCKWWVQNSPFRGLVYRGVFLRSIFFHEGLLVLVWLLWQFRLIADARFANANCDFLLIFKSIATFWPFSSATYWGHLFSRPLSTSGTAIVAKFRPPSVTPWTDVILTKKLLRLYFPRTF